MAQSMPLTEDPPDALQLVKVAPVTVRSLPVPVPVSPVCTAAMPPPLELPPDATHAVKLAPSNIAVLLSTNTHPPSVVVVDVANDTELKEPVLPESMEMVPPG